MTEPSIPAPLTEPGPDPTPAPIASRPRVRIAAIVWGLALAALGVFAITTALSPVVIDDALDAASHAGGTQIAVVVIGAVLVIGVVITLGSVLAAVRRLQDRPRP